MYQKNRFFQKFVRQVVTSAVLYLNSQNFIITTFKTHQILCLGKTKNLVCLMNIIYLSNVQKIGFSNKGTNLWDTFFIKILAFFGMFGLLNDVILEEIWPSLCSMNYMTCEELHTQRIWFKLWNYRFCEFFQTVKSHRMFDLTPQWRPGSILNSSQIDHNRDHGFVCRPRVMVIWSLPWNTLYCTAANQFVYVYKRVSMGVDLSLWLWLVVFQKV